jgi:hypothetical protein
MRQGSADLTVQVSPFGLIELSDEEFEVNGPRLNRYAQAWAFYLGNHWGYMRELGESRLTFNYARAMSDYMTNFCFSKGVTYKVPRQNEAVIPSVLNRVWTVDNKSKPLLWEIGQTGSVTGDAFVKVAYEDGWEDPSGGYHPGRVRILPLNPSFCFPEWHPHDRNRMIRFKLKYRFWGTSLDGTRSVFTYTELITDNMIEEYINDELIDSHPNPLGEIPIVHIPNLLVGSSPWGMPDIPGDFLSLNRQYNETATALADIINYHAEPVTIVVGAKAAQLEAGAKKVWSGFPKDAQVYNLEMASDASLVQGFLEMLKQTMHEMAGIPVSALGQAQAVSNTSGVALQIQYMPTMMRFEQKSTNYGAGLEKINYFCLKTLALKEPEVFVYDPSVSPEPKEGQLPILDRRDPITYRTEAKFQTPLPIDRLIKLNEIMSMMSLGLESKRGALKELGIENPDLKLEELIDELTIDLKDQGALDLLRTQIADAIALMTFTGGDAAAGAPGDASGGGDVVSAGGPQVNTAGGQSPAEGGGGGGTLPGTQVDPEQGELMDQLSVLANGTKLPQRRMADNDDDN